MPQKNQDLHGNAPDKSRVVLLIIDVLNDLEWEGGEEIKEDAIRMAQAIATLKKRAKEAKIPTIYVNDNFGRWKSDFQAIVEHCLQENVRGKELVELLQPDADDYFVLKPKHSGFFSTTLDTLLQYLDARTLILTGLQTNICVLFTANDAYMRDFHLYVPSDCVAAEREEENKHALEQIEKILKADIRPSAELDLQRLKDEPTERNKKASA